MYAANEFHSTVVRSYLGQMAEFAHRLTRNAIGRYYVDDTCIDCDLCRSTAPAFFARDDESGYSYTHHQPRTADEIAQAEECRIACPTESIGNDGDQHPERV